MPSLHTDADLRPRYIQLCAILNSNPIGELLESVQEDERIDLAEKYISDYTRSARNLFYHQNDKQIQVINALQVREAF